MKFSQYLETPEKEKPQKIFVIFPGGFSPFHKGHKIQYDDIKKKFKGVDVDIMVSSGDTSRDGFTFTAAEKVEIIKSYGIPKERIHIVKDKTPEGKLIQRGSFWNLGNVVRTLPDVEETTPGVAIVQARGAKEDEGTRRPGVLVTGLKDLEEKYAGFKPYEYRIPKTTNSAHDISGSDIRQAIINKDESFLSKHLSPTAKNIVLKKERKESKKK